MGQAISNIEHDDDTICEPPPSRLMKVLPSLLVALVCTGLIAEAVVTALHGRQNGDLMVIVCPILGAVFISIPTVRAWWAVLRGLWEK
jgi:hypothetical protein